MNPTLIIESGGQRKEFDLFIDSLDGIVDFIGENDEYKLVGGTAIDWVSFNSWDDYHKVIEMVQVCGNHRLYSVGLWFSAEIERNQPGGASFAKLMQFAGKWVGEVSADYIKRDWLFPAIRRAGLSSAAVSMIYNSLKMEGIIEFAEREGVGVIRKTPQSKPDGMPDWMWAIASRQISAYEPDDFIAFYPPTRTTNSTRI